MRTTRRLRSTRLANPEEPGKVLSASS
jgi:hypothetical protein